MDLSYPSVQPLPGGAARRSPAASAAAAACAAEWRAPSLSLHSHQAAADVGGSVRGASIVIGALHAACTFDRAA